MLLTPPSFLLLSALLHSYDCFEMAWAQQGKDVQQRFRLIEEHWLYFLGYGALLATLSVVLRFWDLFVIRAVLYPIYIANAPHARFDRCAAGRFLSSSSPSA